MSRKNRYFYPFRLSFQYFFSFLVVAVGLTAEASYFSQKDFGLILGGQASTISYKRGIITYEGAQAVPFFGAQLFHPDWLFAGSALYYRRELSKNLLFRTRLNFDATGDDPLYETSEDIEARVTRESTTELDLILEYTFSDDSFLRFLVSQDLVAHNGHQLELRGRWAIYDVIKKSGEKALAQLGLFAQVGYGNGDHNEYLYGVGAEASGFNHVEYGLSVTSPKVIEAFWPTMKLTRFHLLGEGREKASYVQETDGWSFEVLAAFKVW